MSDGVLVVGGGISGLAAAYDLMRAGVPVTVAEASDRWGGKVSTHTVDGFVVEAGPDSFVSYRPAAQRLAEEVGLGDEVVATLEPREVWLRRDGQMVPLPDDMGVVLPTRVAPFVGTRLLTWPQKVRAGLDVVLPRTLGPEDTSVGAFLRRRLGDALVTRLADPLFGGIYGTSVDDLSLDAVLPALRAAEAEHRSLLLASLAQGRTARAARPPGAARAGSVFRSLRRGMGSLPDALVEQLGRASSVCLRPETSVTQIATVGCRTRARMADGSSSDYDAVVLAAPGPVVAPLLGDELPVAASLVAAVRHASTAVVSLGFAADAFDRPPAGHGFLEAGEHPAVFSGCTITSSKWADRAPPGTVLLRAFVPNRSSALLRKDDRTVIDVVERQVGEVLTARRPAVMRHLARWVDAMPVYTVGHRARMDALDEAMAQRPTWVLAGATYRGVGVPDCVGSGRAAAARARGAVAEP